jgi:molecular chaperone HscB
MSSVDTVRCWRCGHEHQTEFFCPSCHAIQLLPAQADYFSVLGIPRNPAVDEAALTRQYYELSRRLHPDLYQTGVAEEKEASLKNTALLNRAYRTLRDVVPRGQYWLELQGEQLGKENNRVPPALAALVFAVQEKLAEVREAREDGKAEENKTELAEIRTDLENQMKHLRVALIGNLGRWNGDGRVAELLPQLKSLLSEIAYLRTLLRDVEKESDISWNV